VGAVPTFLSSGIVPGGDAVVKLWGPERAAASLAAVSMIKAGIPFSFSHDAPVSPQPWVLALVDAGVNRRSASGQVIGPEQRVTPYQALRAVTANAAWQIKEGRTIFRRGEAAAGRRPPPPGPACTSTTMGRLPLTGGREAVGAVVRPWETRGAPIARR
jgi:hypothetical protein